MKILLAGRLSEQLAPAIAQSAPECRIDHWWPGEPDEELAPRIEACELLVLGADAKADGRVVALLPKARRLRLLQLAFAGYDWLDRSTLSGDFAIANTHGHSSAIAEFVVAALLDSLIGFADIDRSFRAGSWVYSSVTGEGIRHGSLRGKRVCIIGYGHIGHDVAARLAAFEVELIAVGRAGRAPPPAPLAGWYGIDRLARVLPGCDFVVVCCALNEQTRGLLDAEALARLKSEAVLVNVARGPVVAEQALYETLAERRIRRAYIDVWYRYPEMGDPAPRPSSLPFHELDNVVMTPHCSSWADGLEERRMAFLADNVARFVHGDAPLNLVDPG